jgi:hypothetical protein
MADISPSRAINCVWEAGEANRPLGAYRVCSCGVCERSQNGVGYLSYSDAHGKGFTIWIQDERVFEMLEDALRNENARNLTLDRPSLMKLLIQIRRATKADQLSVLNWLNEKFPNDNGQAEQRKKK